MPVTAPALVLVAADSDESGQPFLSPDDLASIQPLWTEAVDRHLMPIVGAVWDDSAGQIHAEMLDATDVDFPFPSVGSAAAEAYLAQARNVYDVVGEEMWATARSEMLEGFRLGESVDQIADRLRASAGLTAKSAVLVARSTVIEASNAGSIATARASGLEMRKEWIATPDTRTRPTHRRADGQVVDLNAKFTVGGFDADFPADPGLPPQEKFRCRCTTGYVIADAVVKEAKRDADTPPLPNTSTAEPAPAPVPPPVEATPAERRAAARARQKAIAEQEPVADFAAEIDQIGWARRDLPFDDDTAKILAQRLRFAVDAGVPEADLAAVRAAVEARDMLRVRAEARRLAQARGLTAVENAGDRVAFDEARHKALVDGADFTDGELVDVHRQGHVLQLGDDVIPLDRAQVRAIDLTPEPKPVTIPPDVDDLGDIFDAAERLIQDKDKYPLGAPLDIGPWQRLLDGEMAGMTVRVEQSTLIRGFEQGRSIILQGDVLRGGRKVGDFSRSYTRSSFGDLRASHTLLELSPSAQGSGFSNAFNGRLIAWYRRSGVESVQLHADIDVGGYAWARQGYDFANERASEAVLSRLEARLKWASLDTRLKGAPNVEKQVQAGQRLLARAKGKRIGEDGFPTAFELSQLGRWPGAGRVDVWIGKLVMLGSDWMGVLRL